MTPAVSFPGGEIELDLSLANEDVLPPGRYPANVAVVGPEGWRWQRSVEITVESGRGPLAVPVLTERVTLDGVPGRYRCAASLGAAAAPAAGRATIDVIGRPLRCRLAGGPAALGFGEAELRWLAARRARHCGRQQRRSTGVELLLVGHAGELDDDDWRERGGRGRPWGHRGGAQPLGADRAGETSAALPFATPISCTSFRDWLYHKECFATGTRAW